MLRQRLCRYFVYGAAKKIMRFLRSIKGLEFRVEIKTGSALKLKRGRFVFTGETVMPDVEITCAECNTAFPFTEREQEYYTERNLSQPKRCKACRDARRSNFGGPSRGAGGGGGGVGGGERQRFDITCDQCGKTDSVPFKPSSGRPVLCGECFSASRAH